MNVQQINNPDYLIRKLPDLIEVQEEYEENPSQYVEVIVRLSDGQRRMCIFATAEALARMGVRL